MLGVVKHCTDPEQNAHDHSRGHPGYSPDETEAKLDAWTAGPTTCAEFEKHEPAACAGCEHRGKIKSPIVLGYPAPAVKVDEAGDQDAEARPTDLALAGLWVQRYGKDFRFDHSRGRWMFAPRGAWLYCGKENHVESFKGFAGDLLTSAGRALRDTGGSDQAKRLMACANRAQSATGTRSALNLAQSDPAVAVNTEEFDRDPDLFNVASGVVHLPSGELRQARRRVDAASPVASPFRRCRTVSAVRCVHGAGVLQRSRVGPVHANRARLCPEWARVRRAARSFGSATAPNGKSVLANVVRHIFGTYAADRAVGLPDAVAQHPRGSNARVRHAARGSACCWPTRSRPGPSCPRKR